MNIVIVGCGRMGAHVATVLDQHGHQVAIVDTRQIAFERLPSDFNGRSIIGTGIDEDVLRSAGIAEADVFISLTNFDNTNLMAAQVAKEVFKVPRVSARMYDPIRSEIFSEMGIATVCVTTLFTSLVLEQLALTPDSA
jgi:trk system potassium uptake protein TrkA